MVNAAVTNDAAMAERATVLAYVPAERRAAVAALMALDDTLARIVRTTREPIVGQMRLTWWHEALSTLDTGRVPAEPVLLALSAEVLPRGVAGDALAGMIDGWEGLLDDGEDKGALAANATARGAALFEAMAAVLGGSFLAVRTAGEGWAYADLALHLTDPALAAAARASAIVCLTAAFSDPWPVPLRPLGMLALLARADLHGGGRRRGSPRRLARLLMHRIWGR